MDHYIEVVWNGMRTRVPVMGTIGGNPNHLSLGPIAAGTVFGGLYVNGVPCTPTKEWTPTKVDFQALADAMCWCGRCSDEGRDPTLCVPIPDPFTHLDADSEYDRDVRGR